MTLPRRLRQCCGDGGDIGDTLRLQSQKLSPLLVGRLGTLGTRNCVSIARPHVPTFHFRDGDAGKPNKNRVIPTVPIVPNVQEVSAGR